MTETNFGASRPVRLTGLGKTVLHREGERAKDGVSVGRRGSWRGELDRDGLYSVMHVSKVVCMRYG